MEACAEKEKVPVFFERKSSLEKALFIGAAAGLLISFYLIFIWSPIEKTMGLVQKIFYIHVASASTAFIAFFIVFVFSLLFIIKRKRIFDTYAKVSAEIGLVLTTIVLTTGPIWAKSSWNTWWAWEPRLTTTLILWFIYMAYFMIRQMDGVWEKKARLAAVFGMIGFIDVPIVFFSIRWWQSKFHPIVFGAGPSQQGGGVDERMLVTLLVTIFAVLLLYGYLLLKGVALEGMKITLNHRKEKIRERLIQ
ncbi:cytochrome c biogenesis protein [Mesobacillus zeae]|uniref:Heme exporter protein C n=1 Tax=Mesobacillus zeae TaxID=1917180 RepID=A0A398B219_9BACI|nr:cytochrome c biogenesis protein CcsA [Mesobacillus zeae]RID83897.1 cytochrome C assembly protein [Mesobacillus zeae]